MQKLLNLIWLYSFTCAILLYNLVLFIYIHYSERWVIEYPAVIYVRECFAYVPSRSFIVSGLMFRSLIHFEVILCRVLDSVLVSFFYKWLTIFPSTSS